MWRPLDGCCTNECWNNFAGHGRPEIMVGGCRLVVLVDLLSLVSSLFPQHLKFGEHLDIFFHEYRNDAASGRKQLFVKHMEPI